MEKHFVAALLENKWVLRQFAELMSEAELHRRIRDYWTVYEHIEHLAATQIVILNRIELFAAQEHPAIVPYTPDDKPSREPKKKPVSALLDSFDEFRDRQVSLIEKATPQVWARTGSHPEYTKYSFEILVRHALIHDSFHMARMEQLWIMKEDLIQELKSN